MFNNITIRARVILTFVLLTGITLTILGTVIFTNWYNSAHEVSSDLSKMTNEDIALQVSDFLKNPLDFNEAHAHLIANNYVDMSNQEERERFFVLTLQNYDDQVYSFSFGTANGEYYGARRNQNGVVEIMRNDASTGGYSWYYSINDDLTANERVVVAGLFDPRTRPWYTEAESLGQTVFSPIYQHFIMEDLAISLATPIYDNDGLLVGVLGTHMILSNINTFLSDKLASKQGSAIIIDMNSQELVANSMGLSNYEILSDDSVHRFKISDIEESNFYLSYQHYLSNQTDSFEIRENFGYEYYAFVEVHEMGVDWLIITSIPQGQLFSRIAQNMIWMILIFILSIILLVLIYQVLIKNLFKPVDDLVKVSNEYVAGNFDSRMTVSSKDEFSKLANAFNYMTEHINTIVNGLEETVKERTEHLNLANEKIRESEQRFKILHDASFGGLAIHDKGVILDCNQGLSDITGFGIDELMGMDGLLLIAPDYRDFVMDKIVSGYEKPYEAFGIRKDGEIYPLKLEARNLPYHGKQVRVVEFRDLTEIKKQEEVNITLENQWSKLIQEMPLGFNIRELVYDDEGQPIDYIFVCANKNYETITGLKNEDIIGKRATTVLPDIEHYWIEKYAKVVEDNQTYAMEDYSRALGKYFRVVAYPYKDKQFIIVAEDITERKHYEEQLIKNENEKSRIISNLPGVSYKCRFDDAWTMIYMSDACESLTGYKPFELIDNQEKSFNDIIIPKYRHYLVEKWNQARKLNQSCNVEYEIKKKDGSIVWLWEKGRTYLQDDQWYIEGFLMDITDRKISEQKIDFASKHDFLTGLPNRRYFDERINELNQPKFLPMAISFIDIDGLKLINDTYGHKVGDEAILKLSHILTSICDGDPFIARTGGDEFIVVYNNADLEQLEVFRNRFFDELAKTKINEIPLSASCGTAVKLEEKEDIGEVLIEAENDMYSKKTLQNSSSRNQVIVALFNSLIDKYEAERKHSNRVGKYCYLIGEQLNLSRNEILELEFAGKMHDIGKITIPDEILKKPGKLTSEEWRIMQEHTINGYQILRSADKYSNLADYALTHHERWDGQGYPKGIKGEEIPLFSRIICVADAYEAMTSDRTYRKAKDKNDAINELIAHSGKQFDKTIVDVFINKVLINE